MYPIHGDYWLVGVSSSEDYDGDYDYNYADEEYDYDEYLFWPSSAPHILVPANGAEHSGLEVPQSPAEPSPSSTTETVSHADELDALDLGLESGSQVLTFSPTVTFTFNPDFVFPEPDASHSLDENGYSRLFRTGLFSKSRRFTRRLDEFLKSAWKSLKERLRKLRLLRR
ncbi:hypothetical protein BC629DRAFT_978990 [Irpex lacteus]|nr:hypothetical protein BC629DRAFT_978990 [Irpex lacteus]